MDHKMIDEGTKNFDPFIKSKKLALQQSNFLDLPSYIPHDFLPSIGQPV